MTESHFVRNLEPHEVSLPERGTIARSRSADPGAPVVTDLQIESESLDVAHGMVERYADLPPPLAGATPDNPHFKPAFTEVVQLAALVASEVQAANVQGAELLREVSTSDRLIQLKSENNKVRAELDDLEQLFNTGL